MGQSPSRSHYGQTLRLHGRVYYQAAMARLLRQPMLILFTMGKVGSSTVMKSIRAQGVAQTHRIYRFNFMSESGLGLLHDLHVNGYGSEELVPASRLQRIRYARLLRQTIHSGLIPNGLCQVITLIRDPVATNLSGFFQNNYWWPEELKKDCNKSPHKCLETLYEQFFDRYPHDVPLEWLDKELTCVFRVDPYASPFPAEAGYEKYHDRFADVLLIRLEDLNRCGSSALAEFLGIPSFRLVNHNIAEDKSYATLYREFLETIPIPESYLDKMYDSHFVRHFYRPHEIEAFRRRWQHSKQIG